MKRLSRNRRDISGNVADPSVPDTTYSRLQTAYREYGLVLAVGAGISFYCGLPGWEELLRRLARRMFGRTGDAMYRELRNYGHTLPAIAGIIEAGPASA